MVWDSSVECLVSNLETFKNVECVKQLCWKFVLKSGTSLA